jgi:hypothetical protein
LEAPPKRKGGLVELVRPLRAVLRSASAGTYVAARVIVLIAGAASA